MRFTRGAVAAVLVAGLGGLTALAQPPGGGRGMGMFGGGSARLVNSKAVQKELKVNEEQAAKLKELAARQQEKMRSLFQGGNVDREKIGEVMAEQAKEAEKEIAAILKEDQVKRLKQIEVQVAGSFAFGIPRVKEALKISDEQAEKIQDIGRSSFKERQELNEEFGIKGFGGRPDDPDKAKEYDKKLAAITKDVMDKIMGTMSDDQKKAYKELTGEAVDVAAIQRESAGQFRRKKKDD